MISGSPDRDTIVSFHGENGGCGQKDRRRRDDNFSGKCVVTFCFFDFVCYIIKVVAVFSLNLN